MKLSTLLSLVLIFSITLSLISCDDNLNNIGGSLQPPGDNITAGTDTLAVIARTVSMRDSVYAQTVNGILGKYEDDIFGTIKSDYLCQFMFPDSATFNEKIASITSVNLVIGYLNFLGDTISPMGLSAYQVTKQLPEYFYTNTDPKKYTDMKTLLASSTFSIAGSKKVSSTSNYRQILAPMDPAFAKNLNAAIKAGTITDSKTFNEYFPGMYVTTTLGSGTLIQPIQTSIIIDYKYYTAKADSLGKGSFTLTSTTEVNQLIHVENKNPEELFDQNSGMVYTKSPAGVCPEIVFPIKKIKENMAKGNYASINTALFSITGYTEKEPTGIFSYARPQTLLLIHKDSVDHFFSRKDLPGKTAFSATWVKETNSYKFTNLSQLITSYKDKNLAEDPTFVLIPIEIATIDTYYNSSIVRAYNQMLPSASIFRNNIKDMRLTLIYTKFE